MTEQRWRNGWRRCAEERWKVLSTPDGAFVIALSPAGADLLGRDPAVERLEVMTRLAINGTVNVLHTRPGADCAQTFVTQVGRAENSQPVQTAPNAAWQQVHYDPKRGTSVWKATRDLLW
jgi:hypothetical protein